MLQTTDIICIQSLKYLFNNDILFHSQVLLIIIACLTHRAREHSAGGTHLDPEQIHRGWLSIPAGSRKNVKNLPSKYKVIFLKNYKSYDKTLQKHFNAYLSYLLKMNEV